jgi:hypothetical protein
VLDDVRQRFARDEVRGSLNGRRETPFVGLELDRERRPADKGLQRSAQAVLREDRRVDAARELPELLDGDL